MTLYLEAQARPMLRRRFEPRKWIYESTTKTMTQDARRNIANEHEVYEKNLPKARDEQKSSSSTCSPSPQLSLTKPTSQVRVAKPAAPCTSQSDTSSDVATADTEETALPGPGGKLYNTNTPPAGAAPNANGSPTITPPIPRQPNTPPTGAAPNQQPRSTLPGMHTTVPGLYQPGHVKD